MNQPPRTQRPHPSGVVNNELFERETRRLQDCHYHQLAAPDISTGKQQQQHLLYR